MIKNISLALFGFVLVFAFSSCEKDRAFTEYEDLEHGAFARLIDGVNGVYDFFNIDGSTIDFSVEFYDDSNGSNVSEYNWTVEYVNNETGTVSAPATIMNISSSGFGTSTDGLPSTSVSFSMRDAMDALGLGDDDINGGDAFRFQGTIVMNDGRTFSASNTGANIISSAPFSGWFRFDQPIICPSDLGSSTYTVVTTYLQHDFIADGFTENTLTGVQLTDLGGGKYTVADFSGGLYGADSPYGVNYGTDGLMIEFQDACGKIVFDGQIDPWQSLLQDEDNPSFVDPVTGVITIAVLGEQYGENWISVYTPE